MEELRNRQVKNFLTVTMLALGVPMILMGDEVRRTQGGNNNAYCHDDESTWFLIPNAYWETLDFRCGTLALFRSASAYCRR